jgi:hypothetical protein
VSLYGSKARLKRLEAVKSGCECRTQPVMLVVLHEGQPAPPAPAPCHRCGAAPDVIEITKIVVDHRGLSHATATNPGAPAGPAGQR